MDQNSLRRLAGLPTLSQAVLQEKKWSGDVEAKVEVPEGTFTKKAPAIVKTLLKLHGGDVGKSMKALTFYINRAGKDVENKEELNAAKALLKEKTVKESVSFLRKIAGLAPITEADEVEDAEGGDEEEGKKKGDEEEEELPAIIKKIAKAAEGKEGEELEELLMKVYSAGQKDGKKQAEEEAAGGDKDGDADDKEGKVEEAKKNKAKPVEDEMDAQVAKKDKKDCKDEIPAVKK